MDDTTSPSQPPHQASQPPQSPPLSLQAAAQSLPQLIQALQQSQNLVQTPPPQQAQPTQTPQSQSQPGIKPEPRSPKLPSVPLPTSYQPAPSQPQVHEQKPPVQLTPFQKLHAELQTNPHNTSNWRKLLEIAEHSNENDKIRTAYESLLKYYPNSSTAQIAYINHFSSRSDGYQEAEELFRNFLRQSPNVDLYRFYLIYVRKINFSPATRDAVRQSYEFALNHIGQDKDSGDIWWDYVQFLNDAQTTTPWESQQKNDVIRATLHRSVQIPLSQPFHTKLWEFLETFENNLSKIVAKKYIGELSPAYVQAKSVARELRVHLENLGLDREAAGSVQYQMPVVGQVPANLYLPELPRFTVQERNLLGKWKGYLRWEESNPLMVDLDAPLPGVTSAVGVPAIKDGGKGWFIQRVQGVYKRAVVYMRWYAEIWFMYYTWLSSLNRTDEAITILKQGLEACPTSYLLTFAYAESLEQKQLFNEVYALYEKFLTALAPKLETLEAQVEKENSVREGGSSQTISSQSINGATGPLFAPTTTNGDPPGFLGSQATLPANGYSSHIPGFTSGVTNVNNGSSGLDSQNSSLDSQNSVWGQGGIPLTPLQQEFKDHRSEYTLVWIMQMRVARRSQGIAHARGLFSKARKDKWVSWELYEAAAMMEYHCSNGDPSVPAKIFEKAVDTYPGCMPVVLSYLNFLISINDENNARALFEKVINSGKFKAQETKPLWDKWGKWVYNYGDLEQSLALERRMRDFFASGGATVTPGALAAATSTIPAPPGAATPAPAPAAVVTVTPVPVIPGLNINAGGPPGSSGEPPIKRFAQRYIYNGIDAIANRDLGLTMAFRKSAAGGAAAGTSTPASTTARPGGGNREALNLLRPASGAGAVKRAHSPDGGPSGPGGPGGSRDRKRQDTREDRDRDRRGPRSGGGGGRYSPPPRGRDRDGRDRERMPPPNSVPQRGPLADLNRLNRGGPPVRTTIRPRSQPPNVVKKFLSLLPNKSQFNGPVFRTDDLLKTLLRAQIPSTKQLVSGTAIGPPPGPPLHHSLPPPPMSYPGPPYQQHPPPPPPPHAYHGHGGPSRGGGRPPPDYGPYQGPGGGNRRRY